MVMARPDVGVELLEKGDCACCQCWSLAARLQMYGFLQLAGQQHLQVCSPQLRPESTTLGGHVQMLVKLRMSHCIFISGAHCAHDKAVCRLQTLLLSGSGSSMFPTTLALRWTEAFR